MTFPFFPTRRRLLATAVLLPAAAWLPVRAAQC